MIEENISYLGNLLHMHPIFEPFSHPIPVHYLGKRALAKLGQSIGNSTKNRISIKEAFLNFLDRTLRILKFPDQVTFSSSRRLQLLKALSTKSRMISSQASV